MRGWKCSRARAIAAPRWMRSPENLGAFRPHRMALATMLALAAAEEDAVGAADRNQLVEIKGPPIWRAFLLTLYAHRLH